VEKQSFVPKLIDLFCGCGGMSLGAARAGFNVVAGIDYDQRALAAHTLNFPNAAHLNFDLSFTSGADILSALDLKVGDIDVVAGGPPCQGFSHMGHRDTSDSRNQLLHDFFRLVSEIKPKAFVFENVPGLLHGHYADWLSDACFSIEDDYWINGPQQIAAFQVGAPTLRKRVFVIGIRKAMISTLPVDLWKARAKTVTPKVRHALDGLPLDIESDWKKARGGFRKVQVTRKGHFFRSATGRIPRGVGNREAIARYRSKREVSSCTGTIHSEDLTERYACLLYGQADSKTKSVRLDPTGYCPTLRAGTGPDRGSFQAVRPIHYLRPRVITPREAARLQGFPDWYQFDATKWHSFRQIGNSVSPLVSEHILAKVRSLLNGL